MKKFLSLFLSVVFCVLAFASCATEADNGSTPDDANEKTHIRIAGMKGPTTIGLSYILDNNANGLAKNDYDFMLAGSADEITPKLIQGSLDMAAVPANLASVLYNKTNGEVQVLAINTLGVLYIVSKNENIESVQDLKGKTIFATGKGTTPEYTLRYILSENGVDPDKDVNIEFKNEATEVVSAIASSDSAVAMLPQPYVTVAGNKVEGLETAIDLNEEWEKLNPGESIVTGVLVVRKSFAQENPLAVKRFLAEYKASVEAVNADAAKTAEIVVNYGIFDNEAVIAKAIPNCNITFISANDMKAPLNKYLGVLYEQNPKSVGGALPKDDFFCILQ